MMKKKWCFFSLHLLFILLILIGRSAASSKHLIGISPLDEKYYTATLIECKDGSHKKFNKSQLNDDFCDCPDGTDEPGTSACPNGKFYCQNAGHSPLSIYSSRVNDGICDCCDGSDEYDGKIECPNTCWEAGRVARDRLMKKIATYQEGVTLRKQEVERAKLAAAKDEAELSKLENEEKILKGLVQQLQDRKEQIDKAEEKERLQKEKEEKERKDAEEANMSDSKAGEETNTEGQPTESTYDGKIGLLEESPSVQHASKDKEESAVAFEADIDTGSKGEDASDNTESLSREELGRIVGSRWTGKKIEQETVEVDSADDHENHEEQPKNAHDGEYNSYDSENEDEHSTNDDDDDDSEDQMEDFGEGDHDATSSSHKYESDDESDLSNISSTSNPSWLEKIQQTVRNILQAVNMFQTPVDKSGAALVRKEYEESSAKLSKIQSRISSLTQKLKHDFGREKEFYSLYGQCLEIKQNKYVYKICPFKQATQEEGHSTTHLGSWDKFEDSYRIMHFSNGDNCWNGPDRSLTVKLRCGLKNEITDLGEPSRCEYEALLSTPYLCLEEKLKELQDKLDLMIEEQPQGHDEL